MLSSLFILTLLLTKTYADLSCMTISSPFKVPIAGQDGTPPVAIAGPEFDPLNANLIMDTNDKLKLDFYSDLVAANVGSGVLNWGRTFAFFVDGGAGSAGNGPGIGPFTTSGDWKTNFAKAGTNCKYVFADGVVPDDSNTVDGVKVTNALHSGITPSGGTVAADASCEKALFSFQQNWESVIASTGNEAGHCNWMIGTEKINEKQYRTYSANVHVLWKDVDPAHADTTERPAQVFTYPITLRMLQEDTQVNTDEGVGENKEPYVKDSFKIDSLLYAKNPTDKKVKVTVAYSLSVRYPYLPIPLVKNGVATDARVATNPLTLPYNQGVANLHTSGDTITLQRLCYSSAVGNAKTTLTAEGKANWGPASITESWDTSAQPVYCDYKQTVSYDMTYAASSEPFSCDIGSDTPFYLNWATCTYTEPNGANGVVNDGCINNALMEENSNNAVGSFRINLGIDVCQAGASDYAVDVSASGAKALDLTNPEVNVKVGDRVNFETILHSSNGKNFYKGKLLDLAIDKTAGTGSGATWTVWTLGDKPSGSSITDSIALTGTSDVQPAESDRNFLKFVFGFVPNVGTTTTTGMILWGDRLTSAVPTFRVTARMRLYWDSVDNQDVDRRRLLYRDTVVPSASPIADNVQSTSFKMDVSSMQASETASSSVSTAAIAGIATAGVVLVATATVIGALVYRRRQTISEAAEDTDSKAELKV
jgi:hypothetical protein